MGNQLRALWKRLETLEARIVALEIEDEDYALLGEFPLSGNDGGPDSDPADVGRDLPAEDDE